MRFWGALALACVALPAMPLSAAVIAHASSKADALSAASAPGGVPLVIGDEDRRWGHDFVTLDSIKFCSSRGCSVQAGLQQPSSWAMMIIAFGLIGGGVRRRVWADVGA